MSSVVNLVELTVGGCNFTLDDNHLQKFSPEFVAAVVSGGNSLSIDRDGQLFRYLYAFVVNGQLPRDGDGRHSLDDSTLDALKMEANYFGIPSLLEECNLECRAKLSSDPATSYMTIRSYLKSVRYGGSLKIVYVATPLLKALDEIRSPFCLTGILSPASIPNKPIFKQSTIKSLNLDELVAAATQSPFGRGTQTVVDTTVRNSFEIPAASLRDKTLTALSKCIDVSALSRTQQLALKPYKLVIYKEGGHFHEHRDTVRGEGHIGTLVVVLNSTYTGGELEVTHGGRTETVTGAYSWVAMYGDCLHKINPVTSGTRVSLIYDIYACPNETGAYDSEYTETLRKSYSTVPPPVFKRDVDNHKLCDEVSVHIARGVSGNLGELIDSELADADSLIVTLQHLYPECQTNPAFLKGGDRALYDLLRQHYDVRVVAATIHRHRNCLKEEVQIFGSMFAGGFEPVHSSKKVKVFIPHALSPGSVLDYTPYIAHTGNMAQAEDTAYIVAGLQLRKVRRVA